MSLWIREKRDFNPGSSALEADALTAGPTRRSEEEEGRGGGGGNEGYLDIQDEGNAEYMDGDLVECRGDVRQLLPVRGIVRELILSSATLMMMFSQTLLLSRWTHKHQKR